MLGEGKTEYQGKRSLPCFCCGVCCRDFQAQMTVAEAEHIADRLGIGFDDFKLQYLDPRWPGVKTLLAKAVNGQCIFLRQGRDEKEWLCGIHGFKPLPCIEWQAGFEKKQCQKGLKQYWRLDMDAAGDINGDPEDIEKFNKYLDIVTREDH